MQIPKSWADITTAQFQKFYPITINPDYDNELDRVLDIACELLGLGISELPMKELNSFMFLLNPDTMLTDLPKAFTFKGNIYKVHHDIDKLSAGQYIDLTSYTKDEDKIIDNLHYLLAIMTSDVNYFGFKKKYTAEGMIKRAELFKELPISITYPMCVFFCSLLMNLTDATQSYLAAEVEQQVKQLNLLLQRINGK